ncbi:group I intron-associated PD-(D/E)XK endonuclease [Flavobacterium sp.]|uniref:group I intron-associated PD-(D/E)XK endonuclease n=1 Tax=Flavobacterium sp. TaxID=239 RepID=UPI0038FD3ED3
MIISDETIKGAQAVIKVKNDLIEKRIIPLVSEVEQLPFDLVGFNLENHKFIRFQIKFASTKRVRVKNTKYNYRSKKISKYLDGDFDFYAIYIPDKDRILYVPFKLGGKNISFQINDTGRPFNWWEDFLEIKDNNLYRKKTCKDFGITPKKYGGRKIKMPPVGLEPTL